MYINIHTHHLGTDQDDSLSLFNQYPFDFKKNESYYSIGIHPIYIDRSNVAEDLAKIEIHLKDERCVAIGEIGLDKLCPINFDTQIDVFKQQLIVAETTQTPVIIHCVRAYQEILHIRKTMRISVPFIFHGYNKNQQLAHQIIASGCKLSFGKNLLYNQNLQTIFAQISENEFFLENDDSPIPIETIYQKASEIKNTTVEAIVQVTTKNFRSIFRNNIV